MSYRCPPPGNLKLTLTGLFLLVSSLFIDAPLRAAETFTAPDGLPEPRVITRDMNLPEQSMSREVEAEKERERNQPLRDDLGRIHYIVELVDDVEAREDVGKDYFLGPTPDDERLGDWHKPAMYGVVRGFEARHKLRATGMFSWVGKGFFAYLTPEQVAALRRDPKVVRITEDHEAEFSAVWVDQPSTGSEKLPWNISAVGGNKLSGGAVTAYVLDGGVGLHKDLTNVSLRISADPNIPPVGCYPHATHVAGIISAPRNGLGVAGVDSSVPVVSVSASSSINTQSNCGDTPSNIIPGLDKIKQLISASGRVGVINISMNAKGLSNTFASTNAAGRKLLEMATPAPGYPGAFIAQSAGNHAKSACDYAYNAPANNDGIMVVGAVDANGQPVVKLNGMNGFRNVLAAAEAGSDYGSCVDIWAPGNNIYSTWATPTSGAIQSGDLTYNKYTLLSGTSMAAPHVAGVAAWLAETGGLTTPAQIEAAVRNYAYSSGAKDPSTGQSMLMANADGVSYTAQPTVEFAINNTVNGNLSTDSATPFALRYDSVGAQSCDLTGYLNNAVWYQNLNFSPTYDWGTVQLAPGNYRWVVNCRSAANTVSSAQATATVTTPPPAPTAAFFFNNVQQTSPGGSSNLWPSSAPSMKEISYATQPFGFSYNSTYTSTCQLNAFYAASANEFWTVWYSVAVMPTYYSWPPVSLARNYYWWRLTCSNGTGGTAVADFFAHVY